MRRLCDRSARCTAVPRELGWVLSILLLLLSTPAHSDPRLTAIRTGVRSDGARIVFDLDGEIRARLESGGGGDLWRVVLPGRCADGSLANGLDLPPPLSTIESECDGEELHFLIRTKGKSSASGFRLPAGDGRPIRFVVDIHPMAEAPPPESKEAAAPPAPSQTAPTQPTPTPVAAGRVVEEPAPRKSGKWRIAIDPGHGGNDPGARRPGIEEKEIVLDVGRRVARILNATEDFDARLTRADDRRIGLRQRFAFAEEFEADAFVSIHVNAAKRKDAFGVEVFFLSMGGASDEASRELALLENEADPEFVMEEDSLLQGIPFSFDLRQSDTLLRSSRLAESILGSFETSRLAASRGVKQAGFAVLKSFQVPSILVEIGFLSNPAEAKRLKDDKHRERLAECIAEGTIQYFRRFARARAADEGSR